MELENLEQKMQNQRVNEEITVEWAVLFLWYRQKRKLSRLQKLTKLVISRQFSEKKVSSLA